ncbi:restriction endonuclease subunit S [Peptoclostridium sp. AF21-18]|nr:restriction endonuclease subunit S [Peptoclostridium sp. AF21-18]
MYNKLCIDNNSLKYKRGILSDIADITMGQSPKGSSYNENGIGTIFFQGKAEFGDRFPQVRLYTTEPKKIACINDTLISVRAPVGELNIAHTDCCIGRGLAAIRSKSKQQSFIHYTMCHLKKELDIFNANGTVFGSINKISLNNMPIIIPPDEIIEQFEKIISPIDSIIRNNYNENCILKYIKEFLLSKLISGELDISNINI